MPAEANTAEQAEARFRPSERARQQRSFGSRHAHDPSLCQQTGRRAPS